MSRGARTDGHHAGPDVARFGATTGPAVLATWAALFEDSDATPQFVAQRHRWRRRV